MEAVGALALPTSSLQRPSSSLSQERALQQVGTGGKFGGRASVLLTWRRRCQCGSPRAGAVRVLAMGGRKKAAGKSGGENERPELKFEANDLMELEFGRLLGEPRQATMAKVLGRKVNPSASYIDIEKKPMKEFKSSSSSQASSEAEFARLLNKEGKLSSARPLEGVHKPQKAAAAEDGSLPGLVKPPLRPGQPLPQQAPRRSPSVNSTKAAQGKKAVPLVTFGPGGFAAQTNKPRAEEETEDYMNLVQKPAVPSPDSYKPSWPKIDTVPPMLLSKSKKAEENDYMELVQKPAIPSPESIKPSWPKSGDVIPSMLIGKANKSVESVDGLDTRGVESITGKDSKASFKPLQPKRSSKKFSPSPGPVLARSPSDVSEERFAKLLELSGSTEENQDTPPETSTSTTVENPSKLKRTPKLGVKPVLAAKLALQADETRDVARENTFLSVPSNDFPKVSLITPATPDVEASRLEESAEPADSDASSEVDFDETATTDSASSTESPSSTSSTDSVDRDEKQPDPEQSILRLVKKASRIAPVRPPKRFPQGQAIPGAIKAKVADTGAPADDRLAGWSEEVKAAVKRSEAALPSLATQAPSETEFDQLLERRKAELRQRPVPPPTPEVSPDPTETSTQQRASSRTVVPSPKPPRDIATANEEEDQDWARAEAMRESKTLEKVVFTRATSNGLLVNFGSLVGFLAAYELCSKRKPPSFSTWAQENGFKINRKLKPLVALETDDPDSEVIVKGAERIGGADEEYKRLVDLYGRFRGDLLLALVGEAAKVVVVAVDRERKQLRFSEKQAEGEGQELAQKRAQLMASLNVGDVVTCIVKRVTNFGAFVELQEVPALIHISELSWNRVTDPSTILNVGQEVQVKVCRLDRYLQRISLSLKQMLPDPLRETLESLDLRGTALDDEDDEAKTVMPELIGLVNRLEAYKGIEKVQIGRRLQGNALAPSFQVYLSDHLDDGFKLLARSGNLVQEVLVQTALDRESMKDAIRQCTFSDN